MAQVVDKLFYRIPSMDQIISIGLFDDGTYYYELISLDTHRVISTERTDKGIDELFELIKYLYDVDTSNAMVRALEFSKLRDLVVSSLERVRSHAKEALKCQSL